MRAATPGQTAPAGEGQGHWAAGLRHAGTNLAAAATRRRARMGTAPTTGRAEEDAGGRGAATPGLPHPWEGTGTPGSAGVVAGVDTGVGHCGQDDDVIGKRGG